MSETAAVGLRVRPEEAQRELARRELARRELARRRLIPFIEYVSPWYRAAGHHRLMAEYLEQVETYIRTEGRTGTGRLMIFEPPRHGKSEMVSRHFPAWMLGKNPNGRVIVASYGADLSVGHSKAARAIVEGERFRAVFGELATVSEAVEVSSDSRSAEEWDLAAPSRGGLKATGVGGAITGKGANLLIVDDPLKNRDEAESESQRERVWNWWTSSAYTRLEKGAAVVIMLTRWHGDDLAGRLIRAMATDPMADRYVVVSLPAVAEAWDASFDFAQDAFDDDRNAADDDRETAADAAWEEYQRIQMLEGVWVERRDAMGRRAGQALWPEKYNEDNLASIRANVGPYDWEALYQQRPYLRSGSFFLREWLPIVERMPREEEIQARVRYWDKASSLMGDYTAGVLMCRTRGGEYYVEHVARGRWTAHERDEQMLETARFDRLRPGPATEIWHPQDPGSAGRDAAEATNRMFAAAGLAARYEPQTGTKEVRAGPFSSMCQGGGVRLVRGGWNHDFVEELAAFPKGAHDDQVDAAASAFNRLADAGPVIIAGA